MSAKKLSIAIISDLHCHDSNNGVDATYLKTDLLRTDAKNHPVESILNVIDKDSISVDLTLCPGDFTNRSNLQGFISGWDYILEINSKMGGKEIVATLGNHDVDSHETFSTYSLEIAKGIKKGFPLKDENDRDKLWSKGCVFIERDTYRILVLNTSHYHHKVEESKSGRVGNDLVEYVEQYMSQIEDDKINLVLAHHHPIDHSRFELGEHDKIINGDKLLEAIAPFGFDLFIHGHKHDPLLRYHNFHGSNKRIPILSAGSFSAKSNLGWTSRRNTFHKIDIEKNNNSKSCGSITTWTFIPRSGWKIMNDDEGFHAKTGFGYTGTVIDLLAKIKAEVGNSTIKQWEEVMKTIPEIEYLIPTEADELYKLLKEDGLLLNSKLSESPEIISNTRTK